MGGGVALGGLGGIGVIVYLLFNLLSGGGFDIDQGFDQFPEAPAQDDRLSDAPDPDRDLVDFIGFVVDDVQASWDELFSRAGQQYEPTKLVLFEQATQTGCGVGSSETGPFYCPADRKVYLDLSFFRVLGERFGAPGDFAQAYVIAHEFGHHVQTLLGIEPDVRRAQQESPDDANELSVLMELQADCFAGVWGYSAYNDQLLESGDLEEGLEAAAAIGDDRIQEQTTGRVDPENFTHGSSEQRVEWFRSGFDTGSVEECNTFG